MPTKAKTKKKPVAKKAKKVAFGFGANEKKTKRAGKA